MGSNSDLNAMFLTIPPFETTDPVAFDSPSLSASQGPYPLMSHRTNG